VFVAQFSWEQALHVVVHGQRFVWPGSYKASRGYRTGPRIGGPIKTFEITKAEQQVLRLHYWWIDTGKYESWDSPDLYDIFAHVAHVTASPERLFRYIHRDDAEGRGEDTNTEEFRARTERYVRDRLEGKMPPS
jgi:hypothetical protein